MHVLCLRLPWQSLQPDCICLGAVGSSNHQGIKMQVPREARNPNAMTPGKEARSQGLGGQWSSALSSSQTFGQTPCSHRIWGKSQIISRASTLHGLGFSSLGMVVRRPKQAHLSPHTSTKPRGLEPLVSATLGLSGELFWKLPKSVGCSPWQKCCPGLEPSTAMQSAYKEPCTVKMVFSSFSV